MKMFNHNKAIIIPTATLLFAAILAIGFAVAGVSILWILARNFILGFVAVFLSRMILNKFTSKGLKFKKFKRKFKF